MLKRILASLAITSLLVAGALLVYWYRSNHGHTDSFTMGSIDSKQSHFIAAHGRIALEVTDHQSNAVTNRMQFYTFQNALSYCLILPALWLAIWIRGWLPRPPGRQLSEIPRTKRRGN